MVTFNTKLIFHRFSDMVILLFKFLQVRFEFSVCNRFGSWKLVQVVIPSMTLMNLSSTMGIVTTSIGSHTKVSTGCSWGGVVLISIRRQGTVFSLFSGSHSHSLPIITGLLFGTISAYSSSVFPHKSHCGNPVRTVLVSHLDIIATATEVIILPRPIASATGGSGTSESKTHLLIMNHVSQPGVLKTWFLAGLNLNACSQRLSQLLIGESNG